MFHNIVGAQGIRSMVTTGTSSSSSSSSSPTPIMAPSPTPTVVVSTSILELDLVDTRHFDGGWTNFASNFN